MVGSIRLAISTFLVGMNVSTLVFSSGRMGLFREFAIRVDAGAVPDARTLER
jgi:hypothetical protein